MYTVKKAELFKTAYLPNQLVNDQRNSIAFVGRSNVGKSSLMNVLINTKIAKVSSTPGKTRSINYFLVNERDYFVDLPGYGYAKRSESELRKWEKLMTEYFSTAERLSMLFTLIDSRHSLIKADFIFLEWILQFHIPIAVILTKTDKLSQQKIQESVRETRERIQPYGDFELFPVSSTKRKGIKELMSFIGAVLK
ncbi:MAG TPA: ribosome biogenesis GTP-binding protein YihA/YsxC [Thermotogota bacterium]|nr:ribosome biogenesis GTP-binding protein YihA/YsxC [Thermotogota bacterium]HPJ87925.1 ribosome biogenesis GTP-binding protein YihA/YsxC [Thermotogota bacterium]HPR95018.1 ribosome biogenesis GTP-binding protein YihA/YsxC [Thermotogota bacterium]